jgi:ComF family protein
MAITFDPIRGLRLLGRGFEAALVPPVCVHCALRRFGPLPLCRSCLRELSGSARVPQDEKASPPDLEAGVYFLYHLNPPLKSLNHGFKYRHFRRHIRFLCAGMRRRPTLLQALRGADAVIPVPLHSARRRERGYNQSEAIARDLGRRCGLPVWNRALIRVRPTSTQTRLGEAERAGNLKGAFRAEARVRGRKILLVDDVCTTGNTLHQCREELLGVGAAAVDCFALAFVDRRDPASSSPGNLEALAGFLA